MKKFKIRFSGEIEVQDLDILLPVSRQLSAKDIASSIGSAYIDAFQFLTSLEQLQALKMHVVTGEKTSEEVVFTKHRKVS